MNESIEFWNSKFPDSEPWPLDTDEQLQDLRMRLAYSISKSADADGNVVLSLDIDIVGKLMWPLGVQRFQYLSLISSLIEFRDPRKQELIRAREEVSEAIALLVIDGWIEWVTVDGHPALHVSDMKAATIFLADNAGKYSNVGFNEEGRLTPEQIEDLNSMPYRKYLQSDVWKRRRDKHLKFAKHRCQVCNSNESSLHVHHRTYERRGYESASDLIVLCAECHELFHKNGRLAQ